ncbi:MAG: phosphatase PAP2 family protein [Bauldia sp.]
MAALLCRGDALGQVGLAARPFGAGGAGAGLWRLAAAGKSGGRRMDGDRRLRRNLLRRHRSARSRGGRARPNALAAGAPAFDPFTFEYAHASFPSGHANTMGALAVIVALTLGPWSAPIIAAAAVVAVSRVMINVHYPSDVVGGALLGGVLAYLVVRQMAQARLGFVASAGGRPRPRLGAVRRILARRGGAGRMLVALRAALTGR